MADVWEQRAYAARYLVDCCGRHLRVVFPGRRWGGPGPDFRGAVLADNIQDIAGNVTRFLVLARSASEGATGRDKTAVVFSIRDRVGALRDLAEAFATNQVNLSSIQSRPSKRRAWDYVFFVELDGHISEAEVRRALRKAEEHTVFLKVLGSWPVPSD